MCRKCIEEVGPFSPLEVLKRKAPANGGPIECLRSRLASEFLRPFYFVRAPTRPRGVVAPRGLTRC